MPDLSVKPNRSPLVRSAALEALSERFRPALLRYFRRRASDASEAEDLVQEVFLRMLHRRNVASAEDARGYLFETASSVLTEHHHRLKARHRAEHEARNSDSVVELAERTRTIARIAQWHRRRAAAAAIAAACLIALAVLCWYELKH